MLVAGCRPKPGDSRAAGDAVLLGPQFSAKKGLLLPDDTRQSLGLRIVEVTEQKVPATLDVQLRIYKIRDAVGQVVLQPVRSLWMAELAAVKGGQACCVMPAKGK